MARLPERSGTQRGEWGSKAVVLSIVSDWDVNSRLRYSIAQAEHGWPKTCKLAGLIMDRIYRPTYIVIRKYLNDQGWAGKAVSRF